MTEPRELGSEFQLAVWQRDSQSVTIVLSGELDLASAPKLRSCLADLVMCGIRHVIFDLANLRFIDSIGIGILVTDLKRLREEGGSLTVRNAGPRTHRVSEKPISAIDELGATHIGPRLAEID